MDDSKRRARMEVSPPIARSEIPGTLQPTDSFSIVNDGNWEVKLYSKHVGRASERFSETNPTNGSVVSHLDITANMRFLEIISFAISCSPAFAVPSAKRASGLRFVGVNEAGAEFGSAHLPGVYNTDYTFPDPDSINTFIGKGFNIFRVPIAMERLTPSGLTGPLDSAYLGRLVDTVDLITNEGAYAIIDPHNFGRFNGAVITSTSDFQKWWAQVAGQFKGNSKVIFDTNNEYNGEPGQLVADLNQAAINGIRGAGATSQYVFVEGNAWSGAWTWTTVAGTDGKTNAQTMGNLTDPQNLIVYEMHQYLDSDGSGTSPTCVSSTVGSERLVAATAWLRSNGKKGILGEFAGAVNSVCEAAVKDMLNYMLSNSDVWMGAIWWAAGPWWPDDQFYGLEPSNGIAYDTYVPILQSALSGSTSPITSTFTTPGKPTTSSTATKSTTSSTTQAGASPTQTQYGQCGGSSWTGPTACAIGQSCHFVNEWYSQCY